MSQGRNTLQIVLGGVIAAWGALLLIRALFAVDPVQGTGAYAAGQSAAPIFGLVLLVVGAMALYRGVRRNQAPR
jgi:hypothetical protein